MSGIVTYKKSAWDGATKEQRAFLKSIMNALKLGDPASGTFNGEVWYVFSDWRINQRFVENLAWANSAIPLITSEPVRDYPLTVSETRTVPVRVRVEKTWVDEETGEEYTYFVWEDHPTETREVTDEFSLGDPLTLAADAQGAVSWFTARQGLPAGWVPDGGEG